MNLKENPKFIYTLRKPRAGKGSCEKLEFCNLIKYSQPLPEKYRNLDLVRGLNNETEELSHWGAGMILADFCPTLVTLQSTNCS